MLSEFNIIAHILTQIQTLFYSDFIVPLRYTISRKAQRVAKGDRLDIWFECLVRCNAKQRWTPLHKTLNVLQNTWEQSAKSMQTYIANLQKYNCQSVA